MVSWADIGIVLGARKHCEKYKIVDIFTKDHGNFSALIGSSRSNKLSIFSNVDVEYSSKIEGGLGFWKVKEENQNWIYSMNNEASILICQSICYILKKVLPHSVRHKNLFDFTYYISKNIYKFPKLDALNLYAYFEFLLLNDIGFGLDLDICHICGKQEEIDYISPKTCHGASHNCLRDNFDISQLFEVPESWKNWKTGKVTETKSHSDLKKSLDITGAFISKNIENCDGNYFRNSVMNLLNS